jgi:RNA polymerase sigma-70 factor (ECF subfamily)
LTRIAMNLSLNALKRRKRRRFLFGDKSVEEYVHLSDASRISYEENREIVRRSLERLRPEFRSVLVLRLMEGYSTRETAEILNIREGTVLSRLARALKKMRILLSPYFGEEYGNKDSRPIASVV